MEISIPLCLGHNVAKVSKSANSTLSYRRVYWTSPPHIYLIYVKQSVDKSTSESTVSELFLYNCKCAASTFSLLPEKTKASVASGCWSVSATSGLFGSCRPNTENTQTHSASCCNYSRTNTQQVSSVESCKMRLQQNYEARAQNTLQLKHVHALLSEILFLFSKTKTILEGQQVFELEMTNTQQPQHT